VTFKITIGFIIDQMMILKVALFFEERKSNTRMNFKITQVGV
jgi:hypothetical protein